MSKNLEHLSEKYFSDVLSKLLDTKHNNNYFANEFIKKLFPDRKSGGLNNSSIFKEYPVFSNKYTKNIDLLFIDLDTTEEIVIAIENKFLTQDSREQLDTYYQLIEKQFASYIPINNIKLVYLTLDGRKPKYSCNNIVCLSWLDDIYSLLKEIINKKVKVTQDILEDVKHIFNHLKEIKNIPPASFSCTPLTNQLLEILSNDRWVNNKISQSRQKLRPKFQTNDKRIKNEYIIISESDKGFSLQYIKHNYIDFKIAIPLNINSRQAMHLILLFCEKVDSESIPIEAKRKERDKFPMLAELKELFTNQISIDKKISSYLNQNTYSSYDYILTNCTQDISKLLEKVIDSELYEETKDIKIDFEKRNIEYTDWSKDKTPNTDIFGVFEFGDESRNYEPRIVIYLETIKNYCDYKEYDNKQFNTIVIFVILHELAHYYLFPAKIDDGEADLKKASEPIPNRCYEDGCWDKTIEESLCNYIAYSQCWCENDKELIKDLIQHQPDDYKYALNIEKLELNPLELGAEWKNSKTPKIIPYLDIRKQEAEIYQSHKEFAEAIKKDILSTEVIKSDKFKLLEIFFLRSLPEDAKEMFLF